MRSKEWGNMREEIADNVRIVGCSNEVAACLHPNQDTCAHSPLIFRNSDTLAAYDEMLPLFARFHNHERTNDVHLQICDMLDYPDKLPEKHASKLDNVVRCYFTCAFF